MSLMVRNSSEFFAYSYLIPGRADNFDAQYIMLSEMANLITNKQRTEGNSQDQNQSNSRFLNTSSPKPLFSQQHTAMKRPIDSVDISDCDVHPPQRKKILGDTQITARPKTLPIDTNRLTAPIRSAQQHPVFKYKFHDTPRPEDLPACSGLDPRQISDSLLTLVDDNSQEHSHDLKIIFEEDLQEEEEVANMLFVPSLSKDNHHSNSNRTIEPVL
jgi:hypothetical protein